MFDEWMLKKGNRQTTGVCYLEGLGRMENRRGERSEIKGPFVRDKVCFDERHRERHFVTGVHPLMVRGMANETAMRFILLGNSAVFFIRKRRLHHHAIDDAGQRDKSKKQDEGLSSFHTVLKFTTSFLMMKALLERNWNKVKTAKDLGISCTTIWRRLQESSPGKKAPS